MANIKSAKKRVKVTKAKTLRNKMLKSNLKTTLKKANVEIELRGQFTYGASVINFMDQENVNAEIATDVDLDQFSKWFIDSIKNSDQGRE